MPAQARALDLPPPPIPTYAHVAYSPSRARPPLGIRKVRPHLKRPALHVIIRINIDANDAVIVMHIGYTAAAGKHVRMDVRSQERITVTADANMRIGRDQSCLVIGVIGLIRVLGRLRMAGVRHGFNSEFWQCVLRN